MKLVSDSLMQKYEEAGFWGNNPETHSLDGQVRHNAEHHPDKVAFVDDPTRALWDGQEAQSISWSKLNSDVEGLAGFLEGLGLASDSIVAVYGTNTIETVKTILSLHRAGLIAALMPTFWHDYELKTYIETVQAKAIITSCRLEDDELALRCRTIAKDLFNIRFVFGFGAFLPDGVVNLDQILDIADAGSAVQSAFALPDPNQIFAILPPGAFGNGSTIAHAFSSNQALTMEKQAFEAVNHTISTPLCPFALTGFTGLLFALIGGVSHARTTHLHHFRGESELISHIESVEADFALLPQSITVPAEAELKMIGYVHKNRHAKENPAAESPLDDTRSIFDLTLLNEVVALGGLREQANKGPAALTFSKRSDAPKRLSLTLKNDTFRSESLFSGPLRKDEIIAFGAAVPSAYSRTLKLKEFDFLEDGDIRTAVEGEIKKVDDGTLLLCGLSQDYLSIDGLDISRHFLEQLFLSLPEVKEAAFLKENETGDLNALVVLEHHAALDSSTLKERLQAIGCQSPYIPKTIEIRSSIQRTEDGEIVASTLSNVPVNVEQETNPMRQVG